MSSSRLVAVGAFLTATLVSLGLSAQGAFRMLRINEVIADNETRPPIDFEGGTPDMVELFNAGDEIVSLNGLAMSDTWTLEQAKMTESLYEFPVGLSVVPKRTLVIFCDGDTELGRCVEPHANFNIDSDGNEPITLWGPADENGEREIIDQVMLPPLRGDVSFGRFPDGAGPAPVPVEQTFEWFNFTPGTLTSFGLSCITVAPPGTCGLGRPKRSCLGAQNKQGANLDPRISRAAHSTNSPAAGEAVEVRALVRDDKAPVPPNIARAEIVYRVIDGDTVGEWQNEPLTWNEAEGESGILTAEAEGRPLDRWSVWTGAVPGQAAGMRVEFFLEVEDQEGEVSTRPLELCFRVLVDERQGPRPDCDVQVANADDVGPCDSQFGGPGCLEDPCRLDRFVPCDVPWTYAVGYQPRGNLANLVVNEVVARQRNNPTDPENPATGIIKDPTSEDFRLCSRFDEPPKYCCRRGGPDNGDGPSCGYDDYVELVNVSDTEIDLSGLWLSDGYFTPRIWQFPAGSRIGPREYLIIWCDDDGSKCPDISRPEFPPFWECPDPNDVTKKAFHTNFELNGGGDQFFIFDNQANNFGVIHGVAFEGQEDNVALTLCPDGDRTGDFGLTPGGSPAAANDCDEPMNRFRRGDSNNDNEVNLSDGVNTLNFLFQGSAEPPCLEAADFDADAMLNITDAVLTFNFLFLGGPPPRAPYPDCGTDPQNPDVMCPASACNS